MRTTHGSNAKSKIRAQKQRAREKQKAAEGEREKVVEAKKRRTTKERRNSDDVDQGSPVAANDNGEPMYSTNMTNFENSFKEAKSPEPVTASKRKNAKPKEERN